MTRALLGAVLFGLVAAPTAFADDASLFAAYTGRQASDVNPAANAYERAARRARRAGTERSYWRVIRADRRINRVLTVIEGELAAQSASSDAGSRARTWYRRANRTMRRAYRQGRRAVASFREVGLSSPVGAISQKTDSER